MSQTHNQATEDNLEAHDPQNAATIARRLATERNLKRTPPTHH